MNRCPSARMGLCDRWAQPELGLQRAKHRLEVGEHEVGAPQGGLVPIGFVAAQAVHARMVIIEPGSAWRVKRTAVARCHLGRCRARCRSAGRCRGFSLEPTDTLPDLVDAFVGARFGQPSDSSVSAVSKRWAKRSTMPRSLAARASRSSTAYRLPSSASTCADARRVSTRS